MAEDDKGIHPEVVKHLMDHNRRISQLEINRHDAGDGEGNQELLTQLHSAIVELTETIKALTPVIQQDVEADKAVAKEGKNGKRRERAGPSGASGENPPQA